MDSTPKTHVQTSREVGKTVEPAMEISHGEMESKLGAAEYSDFPSSETKSYETYSKRIGALAEALGNKDSVKG